MESRTTTLVDEDGNEFVVRTPRLQEADPVQESMHHKLIVAHWTDVAAASHLGFKRYGIGAVIVQERDTRAEGIAHDFEAHSLSYAPAESAWIAARTEDAIGTWLDDRFQSYDPSNAAIVLFPAGEALHAYAVEGTPSPPYAFKLARAQYN